MQPQKSCNSLLNNCKPYFAMILLSFGYAGMDIITKISLNRGMSHYVLVVYCNAIATAVIAPFAIFLERPVIDQNFYYAGLNYTSPTFACAINNMLPAMTFIMAIIFRMEKIDVKKVIHQAKIVGTIVTAGGAMLMTLYKGPVVEMVWSKHVHPRKSYITDGTTDKDWSKGSIFLIIATFAWASSFILQGIVASSIAFYVQGLVMKTKGTVFTTAFSPLTMIIVAIMGSFILAEKIFLGGIVGSVFIIAGLYSVLWGKYREEKASKLEGKSTGTVLQTMIQDASQVNQAFALEGIEAKEADKLPSVFTNGVSEPALS
ncbi:hypothetical protein Vadar_021213 [Vaccinium darrowii]|uniref:Uncharacterized protein n=1 Tax=Vaccinium darrowii TaxID=229202 RepID=A0ACB7ZDR1_9ERIC|nr:hypothetical protein Vadar_021213 [Vaccinium darrowii]